ERGVPVTVGELVAAVDVLQVDGRRGIVEDVLQPLLALTELLRRLLALERLTLQTMRGGCELGGAGTHPRLQLGGEPGEAVLRAAAAGVFLDPAPAGAPPL